MASIIWNNLKGLKDKNEAFFGGAFCFALDWKFWRYRETQKYVIKAILNLAAKNYARSNLTTLIPIFQDRPIFWLDFRPVFLIWSTDTIFSRMRILIQSKGFRSYFSGKFLFNRFEPDYTSSFEFNSSYKLNEGAIKGIFINIISKTFYLKFYHKCLIGNLFFCRFEKDQVNFQVKIRTSEESA